MITFIVFLLWALYLSAGLFWLNFVIQRGLIEEPNVIGSLVAIMIWPIILPLFLRKKK